MEMQRNEARVRIIQAGIASVFMILGAWCLLAPASVLELTVRPEYRSDALIAQVAVGAFGAQAMIAGLFAAFSRFTRATFGAYAVVLLPFFVFDWWFYVVEPVFNELILLDAFGNVIMLALCVWGWQIAGRGTPSAKRQT
jgi:hypothetical protein